MAVRPIRLFGDPVLRAPSASIDVIDDGIRSLVQDLLDTVELPGRAGVAAPQIGVGLRAFSYNIDGDIGYVLNPVLTEVSGEPALVGEGCLSVPDLWHETLRYPGEGLMAQALQHETDHLDGMLYISRLSPDERKIAMRRIRESSWF